MTTFLWLLVVYKNGDEVASFINQLRALPGSDQFRYAVCDNSPDSGTSHAILGDDVVWVRRPDNPGYLEGAWVAREEYLRRSPVEAPSWTAISNTDLTLASSDVLAALSSWDESLPWLIAPRITEGDHRSEKNPHVFQSRPLWRHRVNAWVTSTRLSSLIYLAMWAGRSRLSAARHVARHDGAQWQRTHPAGTEFYSPYGALMLFSRGFFEHDGELPRNIPLQSEEYFLAEAAIERGAPVVYVPDIHAHHAGHSTTGPKVNWTRAAAVSRAFRAIYEHSRSSARAR